MAPFTRFDATTEKKSPMPQVSLTDVSILKRELVGLFDHIQRIRKEIASIRRPGTPGEDDRFTKMSDELDAIVDATEEATETIMSNAEQMEALVSEVKAKVGETHPEAMAILDGIPDRTAAIFEACAFQDITGQRITKVVKSLQYIEQRVNSLIGMWGTDQVSDAEAALETKTDETMLLNGPQLKGQGVSQADVDAMFERPDSSPSSSSSGSSPSADPMGQDLIDDLFK